MGFSESLISVLFCSSLFMVLQVSTTNWEEWKGVIYGLGSKGVDFLSGNAFASIQKRLEFLNSEFKATRRPRYDQLKRLHESAILLKETYQMLQAYLEIVRQEDSA